MPISISKDKIKTVQAKRPGKIQPENSAKIQGYWCFIDKGNKANKASWVRPVKDWDPVKDELVFGDFIENHDNKWLSDKEADKREGTNIWFLTEGVYQAKLFEGADAEKGVIYFYAVDPKGELFEITGDQASELAAESNGKTFAPKPKSKQHGDADETPEGEPED